MENNRIIKFRGKRKDNEKWIYGNLIIDEDKYYICLGINEHIKRDDYEVYMIEVIPETIGQFTGLYDKNRKEIYEGDIVKINAHNFDFGYKQEEIRQIKFIDGSFGIYKGISKNEYYFNDLATEVGYGEIDYYEVIGNVWENKELLNETNR